VIFFSDKTYRPAICRTRPQHPADADQSIGGDFKQRFIRKMLSISPPIAAQAVISPEHALMLARQRFPNLCSAGILGRKAIGQPVDLEHVSTALSFLAGCRKSKFANCHSFDLRRRIGGVSLGAVIAAAVGLGFSIDTWQGTVDFLPHCLIGVDPRDVERMANSAAR
jgi:hypothetical protein